MDILNLLFNPNGRSAPPDFYRGAILLTGFWIVCLIAIGFGPVLLGRMISLFTLASVYCYLCVYGKRLHDSGKSAWLFTVFLFGFFFVFSFVGGILTLIFSPDGADLLTQWETLRQRGNFEDAAEMQPLVFRAISGPMIMSMLIVNGILGYIAGRFKSDPHANVYGLPTVPGEYSE